jgi:putative transposase
MTNYRRNFVPGGSCFFTVNLADRTSRLLTDHIDLLRTAFRNARVRQAFMIDAIVILPDHLHAIWSLPEGDADFATRWRHVKAMFSRASRTRERISESRLRKGERGIKATGYWEHALRDERDFSRHVDYIHFNPVKHGLVTRVEDWPYSSFHRMVRLGVYEKDWVETRPRAARVSGKGDGFRCAPPILRAWARIFTFQ